MRNTLKFSLFGTVLCAMSMMFNAGYSVEYNNNSFDSTNLSYSAESEDEFMDRVGKIIKAADKYGSVIRGKDGAMTVGRFGTVTKAEMDRYYQIKKERGEQAIYGANVGKTNEISMKENNIVPKDNSEIFERVEPNHPQDMQMFSTNRNVEGNKIEQNKENASENFVGVEPQYIRGKPMSDMDIYEKRVKEKQEREAREEEYMKECERSMQSNDPGYLPNMQLYNLYAMRKQINGININTNIETVSNFTEKLRNARKSYFNFGIVSILEAFDKYLSLEKILRGNLDYKTVETLATELLQDNLLFISEFSPGNKENDGVRKLFASAWFKIFEFAKNNNLQLYSKLLSLEKSCFQHFYILITQGNC